MCAFIHSFYDNFLFHTHIMFYFLYIVLVSASISIFLCKFVVVQKAVTQIVVQITHISKIIRYMLVLKFPSTCDIYVIKIRPFSPSLNRTYVSNEIYLLLFVIIPPLISTGLNQTDALNQTDP
jgi:hypothetical protein